MTEFVTSSVATSSASSIGGARQVEWLERVAHEAPRPAGARHERGELDLGAGVSRHGHDRAVQREDRGVVAPSNVARDGLRAPGRAR